jgi:hypothetical protein
MAVGSLGISHDITCPHLEGRALSVTRSILLFLLASASEIGGAWLIWQGIRDQCVPAERVPARPGAS